MRRALTRVISSEKALAQALPDSKNVVQRVAVFSSLKESASRSGQGRPEGGGVVSAHELRKGVVEGRQKDGPAFGAAVAAAASADFEPCEVPQEGWIVLVGYLAGRIEEIDLIGQEVGSTQGFVYCTGEGTGQGWEVGFG